jgi:hypothetical protein
MPYTINSEGDPVEVTLAGRLSYETIAAMLEELDALATAALPVRLKVLVDETDARPGLLGFAEIRRWVDHWKRAAVKQGRIAVVAPTWVMFGLNRMAHGLAGADSDEHLAVFRDRDAAMDWLLQAGTSRD